MMKWTFIGICLKKRIGLGLSFNFNCISVITIEFLCIDIYFRFKDFEGFIEFWKE
jgi:hypothetical protein